MHNASLGQAGAAAPKNYYLCCSAPNGPAWSPEQPAQGVLGGLPGGVLQMRKLRPGGSVGSLRVQPTIFQKGDPSRGGGEIDPTVRQDRKPGSCMTRGPGPRGRRQGRAGRVLELHPVPIKTSCWCGLSFEIHPTLLHTPVDGDARYRSWHWSRGKGQEGRDREGSRRDRNKQPWITVACCESNRIDF